MNAIPRQAAFVSLALVFGCAGGKEPELHPAEPQDPEPPASTPAARPRDATPRFRELIAALGSEDVEHRHSARAELLSSGMQWTDDDMEELKTATFSPDAEVAGLAGRISAALLPRREVVRGLASLRPEDVDEALFKSGAGRLHLLREACKGWRAGDVAGRTLALLAELSVDEEWGALMSLEIIAGYGAAELCRGSIVRCCDSHDIAAAAFASWIAGRYRFVEATPRICRSLERVESEDSLNRDWLVEAAATLGVAEDSSLIQGLSVSNSPAARKACAVILKRQFRWESADIALRLASDEEESVRFAAIDAICTFGLPAQRDDVVRIFLRGHWISGPDLEAWRGDIDPVLLAEWLKSEDAARRRSATWLLQWARQPAALLRECMGDPDASVRAMAAYAAGRSRHADLVPALIEMLTDTSPEVAGSAAVALGMLKSPAAIAPLRTFVQSGPADCRNAGFAALALLGDPAAIPDLLAAFPQDALSTMEYQDASRACDNLGLIGGSRALQRLRALEGEKAALCRLETLSWYGEPEDARLLLSSPPGLVHERASLRLHDNLGVVPADIEARLRDGLTEEKWLAALNLRHLPDLTPSKELEAALARLHDEGDRDPACVSDTANVALGRSTRDQTLRVLATIRANGDPAAACAIAEALLRTHDARSWERWTREEKVTTDICTAADAAAMLADRGIAIDPASCTPFFGRVAAGQIISPRRLSYRFIGARCPDFEGNRLRLIPPSQALRHWTGRLAR